MEGEKEITKEYNDQENNNTLQENSKKLISLDNADFSNKSQIINSPRSLEACFHLGIEPLELYKLSANDFKKKYPEVKQLSQDLFEYRYDCEEQFRNETIEKVKKERKAIIEQENRKIEENKNKENQDKNQLGKNEKDESEKIWEKRILYIP